METGKADECKSTKTMTNNNFKDKLSAHILEKFPLARKRHIQAGESLLGSGVLDSLGILDLVHYLETEFSITVADEELLPENFDSIDSIAEFVQRKTAVNKQ
jgi:acyl carrier protein